MLDREMAADFFVEIVVVGTHGANLVAPRGS